MALTGLKKRIHAGERIVGVGLPLSTSKDRLEEILGQGPYDFVNVDSQHSALNEERLVEFCQMADEHDVHVQFRIKHTRHTYMIGNYLDLGPYGVEVPQTELESTVEEALESFYYSPEGGRSYGGAARQGAKDHPDPVEYAAWWNQFGVLWMQIESVEAVTQARALAKSGVDCLSFGPIDLMFSLKRYPHHSFNTMDDCVAYVVKALEDTSAAVCVRSYAPDLREKYFDMGVTVLLESPVS